MKQFEGEAEAELEATKAESIATMKVVAGRCLNAEKMAWTLFYVLNKRPNENGALNVLTTLLHDFLSTTATMVKKIQHDEMAIDIAKMNLEE